MIAFLSILFALLVSASPVTAQQSIKFGVFTPSVNPIQVTPTVIPPNTGPTNPATPEECARLNGRLVSGTCRLEDTVTIDLSNPAPNGDIVLNTHRIHELHVQTPDAWANDPVAVSIQCPNATGFNFATTLSKKTDGSNQTLLPLLFKGAQGQSDTCTFTLTNTKTDEQYTIQMRLVDPYGIVSDTQTGKPIAGAIVLLYQRNPDGTDILWPGAQYDNQKNPQMTREDGAFSFLVPPGTYYLLAKREGYHQFQSEPLSVVSDAIQYNILLTKTLSPISGKRDITDMRSFSFFFIMIAAILALILIIAFRNRRARAFLKRYERKTG